MAFWQQGLGGDWRLATAVQQPSYVELRQPDKYVFIWVQYIWFDSHRQKNAACITLLHTKLISQLATVDCVQRANYMKQKYFDCNEHNFIFVKLETFNTHMTSQRFLVLCRHRIILFFSNCTDGTNYMKQRQVLQQAQFHIVKLNTWRDNIS